MSGLLFEVAGWINEDDLPDNYPYDAMWPHSKVDGVRLFPVYLPLKSTDVVDYRKLSRSYEDTVIRLQHALDSLRQELKDIGL